MKTILLVLSAFLLGWSSADDYTAPFTSAGTAAEKTKLYIASEFGSNPPNQLVKTHFYLNDGDPNPQLLNKRTCGANGFDPSASTTFNWISSFPGGVIGADRIYFGDPIEKVIKLRILNDDCREELSFISLRPRRNESDDFTFIGDFLEDQPDPVVVINYAQIGASGKLPTSGTLAVANRLPSLCSNDWKTIPAVEVDGYDSWALEVQSMSYTEDILPDPVKAKLSLDDYNLFVPDPYYTSLLKQLKASTDGYINCNPDPTNVIILRVKGFNVILGPSEYIDQTAPAADKKCKVRISVQPEQNKFITLPLTIFRKYCLLLDVKNKNVGISPSLKPVAGSTAAFVSTRGRML